MHASATMRKQVIAELLVERRTFPTLSYDQFDFFVLVLFNSISRPAPALALSHFCDCRFCGQKRNERADRDELTVPKTYRTFSASLLRSALKSGSKKAL